MDRTFSRTTNNGPVDPAAMAPTTERDHVNDHQGADVACHHVTVTTAPLSREMPSADDDSAGFLSDALFACAPPAPLHKAPVSTMPVGSQCADHVDNSDLDMGRRRRRRHHDDDSNFDSTWRQMASMAVLALAISVLVVTVMRPLPASGVADAPSDILVPTTMDNATTPTLAPCHCAAGPQPGPTTEGRLTIEGSVATCTCTWPAEKATTSAKTDECWMRDFFSNLDVLVETVLTALVITAITIATPFLFLRLFFGA
ncbi:hypothetical protein pclt_cds_896 [Pandoravirus celtis]|uniref:Uncharacterized protein n=1 Tax=Pandoravirus celtis TaxID=2568002 RepID=A0A4D6EJJ7_9VIRU|nr:hypothetical protein pclt_cds_896 [Pandoravirus celtis]